MDAGGKGVGWGLGWVNGGMIVNPMVLKQLTVDKNVEVDGIDRTIIPRFIQFWEQRLHIASPRVLCFMLMCCWGISWDCNTVDTSWLNRNLPKGINSSSSSFWIESCVETLLQASCCNPIAGLFWYCLSCLVILMRKLWFLFLLQGNSRVVVSL